MKIDKKTILEELSTYKDLKDLSKLEEKQFKIPVYQRSYAWDEEQLLRLIDDIFECVETNKEHFTASIIYQPKNIYVNYLIDGQQRFVTVLLIAKAFELLSIKTNDEEARSLFANLVYKDGIKPTDNEYKIDPSRVDKDIFKKIMSLKKYEHISSEGSKLAHNFKLAYETLKEKVEQTSFSLSDFYYKGIGNLVISSICLDRDSDAQIVFESINSLGVSLTNAELIKNFLLMTNDDQDVLYENTYYELENITIGTDNIESFFKDYLYLKTAKRINEDKIYKEFVLYAKDLDKTTIIEDLKRVANLYVPLIKYLDKDSKYLGFSKNTILLFKELLELNQNTVNPFILHVLEDYESKIVNEEELQKILNLIINYVVRRKICRFKSSSLRVFFLTLYNKVFKRSENKKRYYDAIYKYFITLTNVDKLPTIKETLESLKYFELYSDKKFARYILIYLNDGRYPNYNMINPVKFNVATVEHIMPQTLTDKWRDDLRSWGDDPEEVHHKYLNTLGNLSLFTGEDNSKSSNKDYDTKTMYVKSNKSKLVLLNEAIVTESKRVWNSKAIEDRESKLAEEFKEVFKIDEGNIIGISFVDTINIKNYMDAYPLFEKTTPLSIIYKDNEYPVSSYTQVLDKVIEILDENFHQELVDLTKKDQKFFTDSKNPRWFSLADSNPNHRKLPCGFGYNGFRLDDQYNMKVVSKLFSYLGLKPEELSINIVKKSVKPTYFLSKVVIEALFELNEEGVISFDFKTMPEHILYPKFELGNYSSLFEKNYIPEWDDRENVNPSYIEIDIQRNKIYLNYRNLYGYAKQCTNLERVCKNNNINMISTIGWRRAFNLDLNLNEILNYPEDDQIKIFKVFLKEKLNYINSFYPKFEFEFKPINKINKN